MHLPLHRHLIIDKPLKKGINVQCARHTQRAPGQDPAQGVPTEHWGKFYLVCLLKLRQRYLKN